MLRANWKQAASDRKNHATISKRSPLIESIFGGGLAAPSNGRDPLSYRTSPEASSCANVTSAGQSPSGPHCFTTLPFGSPELVDSRRNKESRLTVSLVICTRERPEYLSRCLHTVSCLNPAPDEVLIVDNTSGTEVVRSLAQQCGARYIVEPIPGLSRARNRGFAECTSEIVAYIDDDAEVDPDWLAAIAEPFADPLIAAVTGETISSPALRENFRGAPTRYVGDHNPLWFEMATFGGLGIGTNMAIRRSAVPQAKLFDERLGRGAPIRLAEESYAFAWLLSRGFRAAHVPTAFVLHEMKSMDVLEEATASIAYWMLLFNDFPAHRMDLARFLFRRLRRKPLSWPRQDQRAGAIISSGWKTYLKAGFAGFRLYLHCRKKA